MRRIFTGGSLNLTNLTETRKAKFCAEKQALLLKRAENAQKYFGFTIEFEDLKEEVSADLNELFSHLNRYSPQFIESYEELFGIFTHGRRAMGKQLNMLKMCFNPEIPILNLRIVRQVLNYSPIVRYSDELTNKMFRHPGWSALGRFPTSQNPFIAYNSNYYAMLLGWFLRSSVDQKLLKMHVLSKGRLKRQRLVRSYDIQSTYAYPGARDNFRSYFEEGNIDGTTLLKLFDDRLNRKAWPLYGMDLMPYVQANYYLKEFSK